MSQHHIITPNACIFDKCERTNIVKLTLRRNLKMIEMVDRCQLTQLIIITAQLKTIHSNFDDWHLKNGFNVFSCKLNLLLSNAFLCYPQLDTPTPFKGSEVSGILKQVNIPKVTSSKQAHLKVLIVLKRSYTVSVYKVVMLNNIQYENSQIMMMSYLSKWSDTLKHVKRDLASCSNTSTILLSSVPAIREVVGRKVSIKADC
ncbi:hypothetical protein LOAG_01484 [Loa loa]|uniref:Uncharacterized protein n=1 Tax=Loa loa TaxID=7209 RepID=A0A1S0U8S7_LOALO|nr:hypothetical protein LOAG_01484 [Loa loa]EFO27001.1 hypothetical protein LOAG_01484 [Loa loa]